MMATMARSMAACLISYFAAWQMVILFSASLKHDDELQARVGGCARACVCGGKWSANGVRPIWENPFTHHSVSHAPL